MAKRARKMWSWWIFILTMAAAARADDSKYAGDDKESRFLSLFTVTQNAPPSSVTGPRPLPPRILQPSGRCSSRLESALDQIKRRQMMKARNNEAPVQMIDLNGYSLRQHLRSAPNTDMYVTRMRVRLPQNQNWVRIERCHFDPRNVSLETRLLFNDLTISGSVNLFDGGHEDITKDQDDDIRNYDRDRDPFYDDDNREDFRGDIYKRESGDGDYRDRRYYDRRGRDCNMILRLRKAGIGFFTQPLKQTPGRFSVKTDSEFIEPGFISVYAYGCEKYVARNRYDRDATPPQHHDDYDYRNRVDRRCKREADLFRFEPRMVDDVGHDDDDDDGHYYRSDRWDDRNAKVNSNYRTEKSKLFGPDDRLEDVDDISREMEDIFTKGIRSLLTTYMQRELQPAIKETLMRNLGYTISYGK